MKNGTINGTAYIDASGVSAISGVSPVIGVAPTGTFNGTAY